MDYLLFWKIIEENFNFIYFIVMIIVVYDVIRDIKMGFCVFKYNYCKVYVVFIVEEGRNRRGVR